METIADDLVQELPRNETFNLDLGVETLKPSNDEPLDDSMALGSKVHDVQQLQPLKAGDDSATVTFDGLQSTVNFNNSFTISAAESAPSEATPYSDSVVSTVSLSGLNHIDSLIDGQKWGGATGTGANLTYSFGESNTSWYAFSVYPQPDGQPWNGFSPFTETQKNATRNALATWSEIANLQFTEVTDDLEAVAGDLRFARTDKLASDKKAHKDPNDDIHPMNTAEAYTPSTSPIAGDVWFSNSSTYDTDTKGTYGYATFMHEIGHALGLKHPHATGADETGGSGVVADLSIDTTHNTVMSYRSYFEQPLTGYTQGSYSTSPLLNDIAAIQHIYGANMSTRSGDTVYSWAPNQQIFEAIWDAGGTDTIDWSNQTSAARINLGAGQWSELGPAYWNGQAWESQTLAISYNVTLENANGGSGDDTILGNDVGNVLVGGDGNDTLTGGAGADIFAFNYLSDGIDTITDFLYGQDDKVQVSMAGFGASSTDQFSYDNNTGALSFNSTQFATLQSNLGSGFAPGLDIILV
jgi:serralysin